MAVVICETVRDYTYDAFGRRVKTIVGAVETEMLYHGWHMIGAFEKKVGGNEWLWQEVPMSSGEGMIEHVALDTNDMDEDSDTSEYLSYAVHEDWQNTVWALSNTSAVVVERYEQGDPFGKSHTLDVSGNNLGNFASKVYHHKRMHGGVVEEVTGLYDFRNRWYLPESGSWLSRDPLGYVDSNNLYQFVFGGPLFILDVFGLEADAVPGDDFPCSLEGCSKKYDKAKKSCEGAKEGEKCFELCQRLGRTFDACDMQSSALQGCVDSIMNQWDEEIAGGRWAFPYWVASKIVDGALWESGRPKIATRDWLKGGVILTCLAGTGDRYERWASSLGENGKELSARGKELVRHGRCCKRVL